MIKRIERLRNEFVYLYKYRYIDKKEVLMSKKFLKSKKVNGNCYKKPQQNNI